MNDSKLKRVVDRVRFGHPAGLISTADLARENSGCWQCVLPAQETERIAPKQHGSRRLDFSAMLSLIPDIGVFTLSNARLFGTQGWIFDADRRFIRDGSWYGDEADSALLPDIMYRPVKLQGTCLSLASDFAHNNYGHFILDCLSRLEIFERAGGRLSDVDHVHIPKPPSKSAQVIMDALGIPASKCRWAQHNQWVTADTVIATSFPGLKRNYPPWVPATLQRAAAPSGASGRKVYVPRTGVRKAVNEAELIGIAREFGFDIYDYTQCQDEAGFFASVSAVVGVHGASLANLAFCPPRTKVLELLPSDHLYPYFYSLADSAHLDYHSLIGQSTQERPAGSFGPSPFDFTVDASEFRCALETSFD